MPIPSCPGYEVSRTGVVRRAAFVRMTPKTNKLVFRPAKELARLTKGGKIEAFVSIGYSARRWDRLVEEAWQDHDENGRPRSSYADGVVLTVTEWVERVHSGVG